MKWRCFEEEEEEGKEEVGEEEEKKEGGDEEEERHKEKRGKLCEKKNKTVILRDAILLNDPMLRQLLDVLALHVRAFPIDREFCLARQCTP